MRTGDNPGRVCVIFRILRKFFNLKIESNNYQLDLLIRDDFDIRLSYVISEISQSSCENSWLQEIECSSWCVLIHFIIRSIYFLRNVNLEIDFQPCCFIVNKIIPTLQMSCFKINESLTFKPRTDILLTHLADGKLGWKVNIFPQDHKS